MAGCLFCKMATGEIPVQILYENLNVFAIRDINPEAPTHILIIPKSHFENAAHVAASEPLLLAEMFNCAENLAKDAELDGYRTLFNTGAAAGQSVFHAHLHLLGGRQFAWPPG